MIREEDHRRLERLKRKLKAQTKAQVFRAALNVLEKEADRADRIQRWKKAVSLVTESSKETLHEFQPHSLFKASEDDS